jgi:hypothetical protein
MNELLIFKPRRSAGWAWLTGIGLVCLGFGVLTALPLIEAGASAGMLLIALLTPAIGLPFLLLALWFPTIRYELHERSLTLRYGPVLTYRIPLDEIRTIRRRDLSVSLWSSMRLPGFAAFTVPYNDVGNVRMCATAAANGILLIETETAKYGLTPYDEAGLVAALQARMEG